MSISAQLLATVRRTARAAYTDGNYQPEINYGGDLLVAQALPDFTELTRLATRWSTSIPTGNAFTTVAAWPTTRAELVISNAEVQGGKSYVIDTVWFASGASLATASSFSCLAQISNTGVALATNNTACLRTGSSGKIYNGNAAIAIANTAFMIANAWTIIGVSSAHPSTTIGAGVFADVRGRFIVPPGATIGINIVTSVAHASMIGGIDWFEVQLPVDLL